MISLLFSIKAENKNKKYNKNEGHNALETSKFECAHSCAGEKVITSPLGVKFGAEIDDRL